MTCEVTKEGGLFVMREFDAPGGCRIAVQGFSAQMILDYANANYPAGTFVAWDIRPGQKSSAFLDLRVATFCLAVALIFRLAFDDFAAAQDAVPQIENKSGSQEPFVPEKKIPGFLDSKLNLSFHFSDGEKRTWLTVVNHDGAQGTARPTNDFHPSFTNMVTYLKPLVRKLPSGEYEITFVSEIAQDLP